MILHLSLKQLLRIGSLAIVLFSFGNRATFLFGTSKTKGVYTTTYTWGYNDLNQSPVIEYKTAGGQKITFLGETNMSIEDDMNVPVIYKANNPKNAFVYSFSGFWCMPVIYSLFPIIIYCAFILAFVNPRTGVQFKLPGEFGFKKFNRVTL